MVKMEEILILEQVVILELFLLEQVAVVKEDIMMV